jgi:hypothetical protein
MMDDKQELTQLEQKDLKKFREEEHQKQDFICPILKTKVDKVVVDHRHKLKKELPSLDGKGLIRGVIDFRANAIEGKITNNWKRLFGADETKHPISLPDFLRNLADYLENPPLDHLKLIHPKEKVKEEPFMKSDYNKIKKYYLEIYPNRTKVPEYPKGKKPRLNDKWRDLLKVTKDYIKNKQQ